MSELGDQLRAEVKKIIDEPDGPLPEFPIKPPEIETEGVFNQDYLEERGAFIGNPMASLMQPLIQYFEAIKPKAFEPPKSEHKVRIYYFDPERTIKAEVAKEIEDLLNDGYCCHIPTVVGDFVIMDFSRRKENEKDGQNRDGRKD